MPLPGYRSEGSVGFVLSPTAIKTVGDVLEVGVSLQCATDASAGTMVESTMGHELISRTFVDGAGTGRDVSHFSEWLGCVWCFAFHVRPRFEICCGSQFIC